MEIWKRHTIHKEIEVSDLGNIRLFLTKQIKRISISDTGYRKVSVNTNNGRKSLRVNRLIAYMFCENPNNYPIVMHLNDIKTDDRAVNLKYGTASENLKGRFISKYKRLKKSDILIMFLVWPNAIIQKINLGLDLHIISSNIVSSLFL